MSSLEKNLLTLIRKATKKDGATDISAQVLRVDGSTAWVHIDGGVDETPVERTIDCSTGDTVRVRLAGGQAYIIGNSTHPPTDNADLTRVFGATNSLIQLIMNDLLPQKMDTNGENATEIVHFPDRFVVGGSGLSATGSKAFAQGLGNILATGDQSRASGFTNADGRIEALGRGSQAEGIALEGSITATAEGAQAHGWARLDSSITATEKGASANGYADDEGTIEASGEGSIAFGWADDGKISAKSEGAFAGGKVERGGKITAWGYGAIAFGNSYANGEIKATNDGAVAMGDASEGAIHADGTGSYAGGSAGSLMGDVEALEEGSFVHGIGVHAGHECQAVFGKCNDNKNDTLFEVGNGTADDARSNAFEVYDTGRFGTPGLWFSVNASGEPCVTFEDGN